MSIDRMQRAVKSVCEKDPGWWVGRRLAVMARQADLNRQIRLQPLRRQGSDVVMHADNQAIDLSEREPAIGTTFIRAYGRPRIRNTVFAGVRR